MKKYTATLLAGCILTLPLQAMVLDLYEAGQEEATPIDLSKTVLTKRVKKLAHQARIDIIRSGTINHAFPRHDKPAQCMVLAHWLAAEPREENLETMLGIFLRANKLCTRKQSRSAHFLRKEFATHEPLLYALGDIMSHEHYPANLPLKPLYKFVDNGRQAILRRKLSAHSSLSPEQIDSLVFTLIQKLATHD